jgi:hypothetical protein
MRFVSISHVAQDAGLLNGPPGRAAIDSPTIVKATVTFAAYSRGHTQVHTEAT